MAFFKRVEVWVLLVLTVGVVIAVLRMEQSDGDRKDLTRNSTAAARPDGEDASNGNYVAPPHGHRIAALQIERDGDYAVLEIRVQLPEDRADTSLKDARLLRTDGSEVAEFFVPSAATPPRGDGTRALLFWADRSTLAGELILEIDGERLKVKDNDDFELDEVKDGTRKVLAGQALCLPRLEWLVPCGREALARQPNHASPDTDTMAEADGAAASAEYLLINNNNSRTKFALADRDQLSHFRAITTQGLGQGELTKVLDGWQFGKVVMASVVPDSAAFLRQAVTDMGTPLLEIDHRAPLGVAVEFPRPESIGADRLANAAAVVKIYDAAPAVVVDFGTAVTFDIISSNRAYVGGVIAPGLDAMTDYLHDRTALLPKIDLQEPRTAIGRSTVDAMMSGAVHGYRGLVRGILSEVIAELMSRWTNPHRHRRSLPPAATPN